MVVLKYAVGTGERGLQTLHDREGVCCFLVKIPLACINTDFIHSNQINTVFPLTVYMYPFLSCF
jgi:hypothetical protein